jgi:hypothetical protein
VSRRRAARSGMHPTHALINPINFPVHRPIGGCDCSEGRASPLSSLSYRAAPTFKCHRPSTLVERAVDRLTLRPKVGQAYTTKLFCPQRVAAVLVGEVSLADRVHCLRGVEKTTCSANALEIYRGDGRERTDHGLSHHDHSARMRLRLQKL